MPPILIEARAPLSFPSSKPGAQFRASLAYVPGGALYGALGRAATEGGWYDEALFRAVRCHNAYPARAGDPWVRPLPLTARRPRGRPDAAPFDTLVELLCRELLRPAALGPAGVEGEAATGFYTLAGGRARTRDVEQRVLTRVAINRRRGTAEDQRLYSPLALNEATFVPDAEGEEAGRLEPTRFLGAIDLPEPAPRPLAAMLAAVTHLGSRQSSGLGAVSVTLAPDDREGADVGARIAAFNRALQAAARPMARLGARAAGWPDPERPVFVINLLADAILLEEGWLPTNVLGAAELEARTGIACEPLRAVTATRDLGGWHVIWGRPRPSALATTMGSLFVYQAAGPLTPAQLAALAALEREGVGERRHEGFGRVRVCDELHVAAPRDPATPGERHG